jgi:hypothetical protein
LISSIQRSPIAGGFSAEPRPQLPLATDVANDEISGDDGTARSTASRKTYELQKSPHGVSASSGNQLIRFGSSGTIAAPPVPEPWSH